MPPDYMSSGSDHDKDMIHRRLSHFGGFQGGLTSEKRTQNLCELRTTKYSDGDHWRERAVIGTLSGLTRTQPALKHERAL